MYQQLTILQKYYAVDFETPTYVLQSSASRAPSSLDIHASSIPPMFVSTTSPIVAGLAAGIGIGVALGVAMAAVFLGLIVGVLKARGFTL